MGRHITESHTLTDLLIHPPMCALVTSWVYLPRTHLAWLWGPPPDGYVPWSPLPFHTHFCACAASISGMPSPALPHVTWPAPTPRYKDGAGAASSGNRLPFLADSDPRLPSRQPCRLGLLALSPLLGHELLEGRAECHTDALQLPSEVSINTCLLIHNRIPSA